MPEPVIRLRSGKEHRVAAGHPWIFSGAIADLDTTIAPGSVVAVHDAAGNFVARGYVNPRCAIAARVLTWQDEEIDEAFIERRVRTALELRRTLVRGDTDAYRLINGEGDDLPGVIADVYGSTVVLQCLTAGAERLKPHLAAALHAALQPARIYERSAGSVRLAEGLEPAAGPLVGDAPDRPLRIRENGLSFEVDVRHGQKTGFFLDQRDNRLLAGELAAGRDVLNAFAYTGAFGVYAASAGARRVVSVESSARALELARRNWQANGLPVSAQDFVEADVFTYLRHCEQLYSLLVLDPPALVRHRSELQRGARAYKDLQLWALRRAAAGALMMTFSCSQHVSAELFWKIVHAAAADAHRSVQVLRSLGAAADHPVSLSHPEAVYLKGLLLHVR